jgi:hypothetical protein
LFVGNIAAALGTPRLRRRSMTTVPVSFGKLYSPGTSIFTSSWPRRIQIASSIGMLVHLASGP